ncbi:carbonic anhydrase [Streptomyces sp. NL15-2K]|nr:carbonic anhydrase [Streptomyces sp. NL15-2K]
MILSCIDSRVPPELLFDTGIGDLFVMRTGGQVVSPVVVGSAEYGPLTSGTPLIVVLGHQRCGAVKAAHKALKDDKPLPGNLQSIAEALRPAYEVISGETRRPGRRHDPRPHQTDLRRPADQPGPRSAGAERRTGRGQRVLLPRHRTGGGADGGAVCLRTPAAQARSPLSPS